MTVWSPLTDNSLQFFTIEILHKDDDEALEEVTLRSYGCFIPGNWGQLGWGFEQPDLLKDVPTHGRADGLDGL